MISVIRSDTSVNHLPRRRGPGQPSKQTRKRIRAINRTIVAAALTGGGVPADRALAEANGVSERTVREIRLRTLGLNRHEIKAWQRRGHQGSMAQKPVGGRLVCTTPYAGLWLMVPQIIDSGLAKAAGVLEIAGRTRVQANQIVLILVAWSALGFRRLFHLDDFRDRADMGLALFAGVVRLWSDTTLWRWVHGVTPESAKAFYQATASQEVKRPGSRGRFSLDEHVVPSFSKLKPPPLRKNRIPTRGRSYPAFRLYIPFDLDRGRFVGLLVRKAHDTLSQVLPDLLAELRRLRRLASVPIPEQVHLIFDRGGYKGSLFQALMEDPQVTFVAMARATKCNVRQWQAIPEHLFRPYHLPDHDNPNLKITISTTRITNCRIPLPSVIIRDDTPGTKQPWRVLFFKHKPGHQPQAEMIDAEYRQRQHHEMGFAEYVHALAGHSLPKAFQMLRVPNNQGQKRKTIATAETAHSRQAVHLVAWIKCLTFNLIKDFGAALGQQYAKQHVATLARRFLRRPGRLYLHAGQLIVQLDPFRGDEVLKPYLQRLNDRRLPVPWLGGLILRAEVAPRPQGLAAVPHVLGPRILANSGPSRRL